MLAHDEGKPRAHAARGEDVLAVADLPDFAPDNAGQGEPAGDADDESDGELVRFAHEGKDQQQGQKDRDTLQEFHRPHHGAVHHAGGDPGQAAVGNPDKGNDRGAHQPDEDGSPAAVPDDRVNVPPQRVRAEPEFGIGSLIDVHEKEFGGIMVDDQVGKKAAEGDHGKHGDGEGGLAFQPSPEAFFPYGGLVRPVPGPDDREGIVGRGVHQHTTPSEDFMRGSMTSLTACATRLLSMTIAPVISTMSISRL